ncbi:MAG TPA: ChaB family protein [Nitrososphaeraceae archaeon]|jgi:cation transport regulator|nr:ChaB family protein [Nitrososphaeraceae archaeon]HSL12624.1 ChaB family protein [Nitrososphaeraceae archaeon]
MVKKKGKVKEKEEENLSESTKKRIDDLPSHAQEIFKEAHSSALEQYKDPDKRRGGKKESKEEVAHKVAWSAVKKKYKKGEDDKWIKKK